MSAHLETPDDLRLHICNTDAHIRGSFKKYVDFHHNDFSRRHITLRFGTHIWTTNSVDRTEKFLNLTRYF